jgi:hypothetical protein
VREIVRLDSARTSTDARPGMTPQEILRQQRKLAPKESLAKFAGRWVVLRHGTVIADGEDPIELRNRPDVSDDDPVIPVTAAKEHVAF